MKRLYFNLQNNLSLLQDELHETIPALRPVQNATGETVAVMVLEANGSEVWITVPDDSDEAAISDIVRAHDHTKIVLDLVAITRQSGIDKLILMGLTLEEVESLIGLQL